MNIYIYIQRERERERERVFTFCMAKYGLNGRENNKIYKNIKWEKKSQNKRKMKRWRNCNTKIKSSER